MKNIYSNISKDNNSNLSIAIRNLKKNEIIGVPTETVYGLAGNAYSNKSVQKIYNLKKRPKINPLIVHYHSLKQLANDAHLNPNFYKLYKKFCPGPITFVLSKKNNTKISNLATAKLDTIAVRFPKNKIIRNILKKINFPLAIPSANKSMSISPVSAKDVAEEFGKNLKIIIDGGPCDIGIESTVVNLSGKINILRSGVISATEIGKILKLKIALKKNIKKIRAPGSLKKHYSPGIPMRLNQKEAKKNQAFITFGKRFKKTKNSFNLSSESSLKEAAKNLYKFFRIIKNKKYKSIQVVKIPKKGIGIAINDRLKHAAAKK
jgi:L-threonylcarbamoyladenylate synthase